MLDLEGTLKITWLNFPHFSSKEVEAKRLIDLDEGHTDQSQGSAFHSVVYSSADWLRFLSSLFPIMDNENFLSHLF